jgi:hypothetical protein
VVIREGLPFKTSNIDTYIAKQCSHVEFPYFVMGSHLGQQHKPHAIMMDNEQWKHGFSLSIL